MNDEARKIMAQLNKRFGDNVVVLGSDDDNAGDDTDADFNLRELGSDGCWGIGGAHTAGSQTHASS